MPMCHVLPDELPGMRRMHHAHASPHLVRVLDFIKCISNHLLQLRKVTLNHTPDKLEINPKVVMNQYISHARDALPIDTRMQPLRFITQTLRGFAQNLEIPENRILQRGGGEDSVAPACTVFLNASHTVENVYQIRRLRLHNGRASFSTDSRMSGLMDRRSTI